MITVHIWDPMNSALDQPLTWAVGDAIADTYHFPDFLDPIADDAVQRFGHAGIQFTDVASESGRTYENAYRAFWPAEGTDWTTPHTGRVITEYSFDVHEEGSPPTHSIIMNAGLNEALVYRYWESLRMQPLDYSASGFNCCSSVSTSLQDGFAPHPSLTPPTYSPLSFAGGYIPWGHANPYYLRDWVQEVNGWLTQLEGTSPPTATGSRVARDPINR